jgi:hypothetical protein
MVLTEVGMMKKPKKHITFELFNYTKFIDEYSTYEWEHISEWHYQLVAAGYPSAKWNASKGMPSLSPEEFTMFVLRWA